MTVSLARTGCRVVAMKPPSPESTTLDGKMIVGPVRNSPFGGDCVAVGFSHFGLALVGHLTVSEATDLANMILSAAGQIAALQSEGRPKQ